MCATARAELPQLEATWVIPPVLLGRVWSLFALGALERDDHAVRLALLGHYTSPRFEPWNMAGAVVGARHVNNPIGKYTAEPRRTLATA